MKFTFQYLIHHSRSSLFINSNIKQHSIMKYNNISKIRKSIGVLLTFFILHSSFFI